MAQNKLETQIKEQLNAREIKPTEMAWDRLDAMLSVAEEKNAKKGFSWMSIAAVFIGLLLAAFVIYQLNSNEIQVENSVVNQDSNVEKTETKSEIQNEIAQPNSEVSSTQLAEIKSSNNEKSSITKEPRLNLQNNHQSKNKSSIKIENQISENKELVVNNSIQQEIKIEPSIKIVPITVNPDKLLASVETSKKEKSSKSSVNVNAKSTLAQAEDKQNSSYKESRFQKLKRNFQAVKIAVENRNIQE